jgi:hypothetical protein
LTQEQSRQQSSLVGSFWLLAAAIVLYVPWILAVVAAPAWNEPGSGSGEARYSEAWGTLFVLLFGFPLWLALGGLILLAWRKGLAPRAWTLASGIFYLFAASATYGAVQTYFAWPGGWSILVPALLPPLLALYGIGVRVPALAAGWMRLVPAVALGAVAIVAFAAIPLAFIDPVGYPARLAEERQRWEIKFAQRDADLMDKARQWEAGIQKLGPDSPLAAWLEYVNGSISSETLHQQALDGARRVNSRQADAVALLDTGQIGGLASLWQLDLSVTPALCAAYDRALSKLATSDEPFEAEVGERLERQSPNIDFLLAGHCDLASALGAAETRAGKVSQVNPGDERWAKLLATLGTLRRDRR